ncbi:MAG: NADH-quinone oxidoreductase subunit J [Planctomycetes bacterium]|nr:NADH-quinone oxidoreductase subunit J [Planctomycetota bacterium]
MEEVLFYIFAVTAILGALSTVRRKNPLASALSLVVTFVALSGLYFHNDAPFVAILQILVYAGAIMVLVVFVIMLLNLPDAQLEEEKLSRQGLPMALFLIGPLGVLTVARLISLDLGPRPEKSEDFGSVSAVGKLLFDRYLFQFELISVVLLVAIVGTVMLAKKRL